MIRGDRAVVHRAVVWAFALATAGATIAIVRAEPSNALAGDSTLALTAEIAAGVLLVAAALAARAPTGLRVLMAVSGVAWLIAE